jgi:transposase
LYTTPVDFRRQIDGLVILAAEHLAREPSSVKLFIFCNHQTDKIKLLWYEKNKLWLCYKRLEKERLFLPGHDTSVFRLTRDQLSWLPSGLNFTKQAILPQLFYAGR